ncbi:MAG: TauD/TfdA family dioxygenase [Chromatiales bacterium]|jgi:alpha-ketoglutarate-dependent taurine dioxygenase|nr:TauD/TfdA family dioxygenase [Chromatiales bacterium]
MSIEIHKLHPTIGARVDGLDLRQPLSSETATALIEAWLEHKVLVLPTQAISDAEHVAFSRHFGRLEVHHQNIIRDNAVPEIFKVSNVDEDDNIRPTTDTTMAQLLTTKIWHTDSSFRENPAMGSILRGVEIVREGGQTCFTDMEAVLEALPDDVLGTIRDRRCRHDFEHLSRIAAGRKPTAEEKAAMPPVWQPMVRIHPVTGRRSLYISPIYNDAIEGLDESQSKAILDQLYALVSEERFVYEHQWSEGDIVMWDNRCTMHRILPYDPDERRVMHRTTVVGDGPVIAA